MKVGRPAGGGKNPNMKHNDNAHKSIVNRQRWFIRNIIGPRERHHKLSDLFDCLRTNWTWNRRSLGSDKFWYSFALLLINSIFEYEAGCFKPFLRWGIMNLLGRRLDVRRWISLYRRSFFRANPQLFWGSKIFEIGSAIMKLQPEKDTNHL